MVGSGLRALIGGPSWPCSSRPSTFFSGHQDVDARDKPGHDGGASTASDGGSQLSLCSSGLRLRHQRQRHEQIRRHGRARRRSFASRRRHGHPRSSASGRGCPGQARARRRSEYGEDKGSRISFAHPGYGIGTNDRGSNSSRHGRACPGHPRSSASPSRTWMPGTSPGMTAERVRRGRRIPDILCSSGLRHRDQRQRQQQFPSWPGLSRPSTFFSVTKQDVDARDKPGHDGGASTARTEDPGYPLLIRATASGPTTEAATVPVMAGLVPAIHVLQRHQAGRGCPGQARP